MSFTRYKTMYYANQEITIWFPEPHENTDDLYIEYDEMYDDEDDDSEYDIDDLDVGYA